MHKGTAGERSVQKQQGSVKRANRFYKRQMLDGLNAKMEDMIATQEMVFIATSDAEGNCDCSPRFGAKGFITVIDDKTLAYPEYRGNGVFASLGNILENPHIGMVFVDFFNTTVGLHVNGVAYSYMGADLPSKYASILASQIENTAIPIERWVIIKIDEAYIHCSKHVPKLYKAEKSIAWGTDDEKAKMTNHFL
ncbi:MAG: pyridoxamine 5'-phosphate oxidase family protein [Flavobacteriaceae bacterium]|nr:pyridoxamine 5'-phosphate oxidase family protein [Flavobacteriaceae bacterium]